MKIKARYIHTPDCSYKRISGSIEGTRHVDIVYWLHIHPCCVWFSEQKEKQYQITINPDGL